MRKEYNEGDTQRQRPLPLSLCRYTHALYNYKNATTSKMFALSHIYTYMTFGLFIHMAPRGSQEHIYIYVSLPIGRTDQHRILGHLVLPNFPSGGTYFPTNSPFTPAWYVALVRSAPSMLPACRVSLPWLACLTRS